MPPSSTNANSKWHLLATSSTTTRQSYLSNLYVTDSPWRASNRIPISQKSNFKSLKIVGWSFSLTQVCRDYFSKRPMSKPQSIDEKKKKFDPNSEQSSNSEEVIDAKIPREVIGASDWIFIDPEGCKESSMILHRDEIRFRPKEHDASVPDQVIRFQDLKSISKRANTILIIETTHRKFFLQRHGLKGSYFTLEFEELLSFQLTLSENETGCIPNYWNSGNHTQLLFMLNNRMCSE